MYRSLIQSLIATILVANLGMAAPPAVGIVMAAGSFTLDDSKVTGNATLFEGSRIETGTVSSQLQLNDGCKIQLAAESKGVVYRDRLVLERGSGRFEKCTAEAFTLRIQPDAGGASADVAVLPSSTVGPGTVRVAAFNGPVRVTTAQGTLLANLQAGHALNFVPQGNEITGVPIIGPAPAVAAAPAGTGAIPATAGPASTTAGAGMSVGAKVAIVAVVAAGAATGAAVAVVKSNDEPAISPSTR